MFAPSSSTPNVEDTRPREVDGEVQRRLAAEGREQRIRPLDAR
jgi:hypothetical protein